MCVTVITSNNYLGSLNLVRKFKKASRVNLTFLQKNLRLTDKLFVYDKNIFGIFVRSFRVSNRKGLFFPKSHMGVFYSFFHNLEKLKISFTLSKEFFRRRFPLSKILIGRALQKKQFFFRGLGGVASYTRSFRALKELVEKNKVHYKVAEKSTVNFPFFLGGPFDSFLQLRDQAKYVNFLGVASKYLNLSRGLVRWLSINKRSYFSIRSIFRSNFSLINNSFFNFSFIALNSKRFLLRKINFFFKNRFFRKDVLYRVNKFILKSNWFDKVYKRRYNIRIRGYRDLDTAILNFFKNFIFLKIQNSVNNLFLTAVDMFGNTISWLSLGAAGSRNAVKKTDYATDTLATKFAIKLRSLNVRNLHLYLTVKLNKKVKNVLRGFRKMRLRMNLVTVNFVVPHNGLRRGRRRRK